MLNRGSPRASRLKRSQPGSCTFVLRDTFRNLPQNLRSHAVDCRQAAIEAYASAT